MSFSRRAFLKGAAVAGAGLTVPMALPSCRRTPAEALTNAWLRIGPDGIVHLLLPRAELGQGIRTALPMIVADELDVDPAAIHLAYASPGPRYDDLGTGGSDSMEYGWRVLREAGAAAREMLVGAASAQWGVEPSSCRTEAGAVIHDASSRRATYGELALRAAGRRVPREPPLKIATERRVVGRPRRRVDGPDIVTGRAIYGLDVRAAGMLFACLARSPRLGGAVRSFNDGAARSVPGVRTVIKISRGVAVVADSTWSAMRGVEALEVEWSAGADAGFSSKAGWDALEHGAATKGVETRREGDPDGALSRAPKRLEATYLFPLQVHAAVEPASYVALFRDGTCRLSGGTQTPAAVARDVAKALGIDSSKVSFEPTLIGGGFGRRLKTEYAVEAAEIAKAVAGTPVQLVWTRSDDFHHGHFQPASVHRLAAGLDGTAASAWFHRQASSGHTPPTPDAKRLRSAEYFRDIGWAHHDIPYAFPSILTEFTYVASSVRHGPWRAVFAPPAAFARESFLDEVASALGKDPLAYRLELLPAGTVMKSGDVSIERDRMRRVLQVVGDKAGWGRPLPSIAGRRVGRGLAVNAFHGKTHVAQVAEVSVGNNGDVHVHRIVCAVDCGLPINPLGIEGQVEGGITWGLSTVLGGEITYENGAVQQSSYTDYPVMRLSQTPEIEVHVVPSGDAPLGLGEPPVPPVAPAVCNAIFAATGQRIRRLPARLQAPGTGDGDRSKQSWAIAGVRSLG